MNKQLTRKAVSILKREAKKYTDNVMITINESPFNAKNDAIYIDGDVVDLYWNNEGYGWDFHNNVEAEWEKAGIFVEPYTSTIFDVYKAGR